MAAWPNFAAQILVTGRKKKKKKKKKREREAFSSQKMHSELGIEVNLRMRSLLLFETSEKEKNLKNHLFMVGICDL